jgi:hypothetical protein
MQDVKGGGGEPVPVFQNCKDCSAIDKGAMILIAAIPIGLQIANQRTRRSSKTLKGSHRMAGGQSLLKISAPFE